MPIDAKKSPVILVVVMVLLLASLLVSSADGAAVDNHRNSEEMMVLSERKLPCYAPCIHDKDCASGHCILGSGSNFEMLDDFCGNC